MEYNHINFLFEISCLTEKDSTPDKSVYSFSTLELYVKRSWINSKIIRFGCPFDLFIPYLKIEKMLKLWLSQTRSGRVWISWILFILMKVFHVITLETDPKILRALLEYRSKHGLVGRCSQCGKVLSGYRVTKILHECGKPFFCLRCCSASKINGCCSDWLSQYRNSLQLDWNMDSSPCNYLRYFTPERK